MPRPEAGGCSEGGARFSALLRTVQVSDLFDAVALMTPMDISKDYAERVLAACREARFARSEGSLPRVKILRS